MLGLLGRPLLPKQRHRRSLGLLFARASPVDLHARCRPHLLLELRRELFNLAELGDKRLVALGVAARGIDLEAKYRRRRQLPAALLPGLGPVAFGSLDLGLEAGDLNGQPGELVLLLADLGLHRCDLALRLRDVLPDGLDLPPLFAKCRLLRLDLEPARLVLEFVFPCFAERLPELPDEGEVFAASFADQFRSCTQGGDRRLNRSRRLRGLRPLLLLLAAARRGPRGAAGPLTSRSAGLPEQLAAPEAPAPPRVRPLVATISARAALSGSFAASAASAACSS